MWGNGTIRSSYRILAIVACFALGWQVAPAQRAPANNSESSSGVVVLSEDDFEQVPEAVRGQSLGAPTAAKAATPLGTGEVAAFDPRRDAAADIDRAVALASREGKHVLLEVGGNWCPYCKILDVFIASQPEIAQLRQKNFVFVKVNFSDENQNSAALSKYPLVRGFPHFFVLDGKGELLRSQRVATLVTNTGYSPERFQAFLKAAAPKR
jgi:thiol-disulfide isomerase/thioredoxin